MCVHAHPPNKGPEEGRKKGRVYCLYEYTGASHACITHHLWASFVVVVVVMVIGASSSRREVKVCGFSGGDMASQAWLSLSFVLTKYS